MKKQKELSRIALMAEDRHLSDTGRESVKEATEIKAGNARRRKINSLILLCDKLCADNTLIAVTYDDDRTIEGTLRRDGEGFILAGQITAALWIGAIKKIQAGKDVLWEES